MNNEIKHRTIFLFVSEITENWKQWSDSGFLEQYVNFLKVDHNIL
jgi:hypothetical protein